MRAKTVRATGNPVNDNVRRVCNWIRGKLAETDEITKKKKYRQREIAEYIGITQQSFSQKLMNKQDGFNLTQLMGILDFFGESEIIKELL